LGCQDGERHPKLEKLPVWLPWISMDIDGYRWIFMDILGYTWISMDFIDYQWISMDIH